MSKEEFLKIQTCELRVSIHCDGCKKKVKRILQKIDGVYTSTIDSEQSKVTISGNVDPDTLIKKLAKNGKRAELWDAPEANNDNPNQNQNQNQNQPNNQFKNMRIDENGQGGNKGPGKKSKNVKQPPNGGPNQQQQQIPNQLQQLQQMRGFQDMPPQLRDMKMPNPTPIPIPKAVKNTAAEGILSGDDGEFDEDEDDFGDDCMDDVLPPNKMKAVMGNGQGGGQMPPNMMMNPAQLPPQMMKGGFGGGDNSANGVQKAKKGGGVGNIPVQMNAGGGNNATGGNIPMQMKAGGDNNANGGKQNAGSGGNGGNHNPGAGKPPKNGNGGDGGVAQNKNGGGGGAAPGGNNINGSGNGEKKGMPNMMGMGVVGGSGMGQPPQMGNKPMEQMGPMGQMQAFQGRPAAGPGGYLQGSGPDAMPQNPYQQQMAAMMMNQQRVNGNERFQPMMYARPPPAINYMPPQPYQPYQQQQQPPYYQQQQPYPEPQYNTYYSEDENTSSCSIM